VTLLAALALLAAPQLAAPRDAPSAGAGEVPALRRVVVVGASLSQGYGLEAAGTKITLTDVVEASLRVPHDPVRSKASLLFFTSPVATGKAQIDAATAEKPTLVVGLDFLFWYGYGFFASEKDRLALLEKGLSELERIECPVVVGDFPDVGEAARSLASSSGKARPGLLAPEQIPGPSTLRKLNERIRAWAAGRTNVVVVPLGDLVARRTSGQDLVIHGNRWSPAALAGFVQPDRLHPTLEGTIVLWLGTLDALVAGRKDVPSSAFAWNAEAIARTLVSIAEARSSKGEPPEAKGAEAGGRR
jgi:hypothetical protein